MRFEYGNFIWVILLIPLILFISVFYYLKFQKAIKKFFNNSSQLNFKVINQISFAKIIIKHILILLVFLFLILAALRPQFGLNFQKVKQRGIDIVFLIDISNSMLTIDIKPNRLMRSKIEIKRSIEKFIKSDRIAIVPFAGEAYIQCPLTFDYSAVFMLLDALSPSAISTQGTNIGAAIEKALTLFNNQSVTNKTIILITDGEDHNPETTKYIDELIDKKIKIYAIGIGSIEGAPITLPTGEFIKDQSGNIVTSRLNEELLQTLALKTGGAYFRLNPGSNEKELALIFNEIMRLEKKEIENFQIAVYEERYAIFALIAFILLVIETLISSQKNALNFFKTKFLLKKLEQ